MKTIVVNLLGGPGAGKSTLAAEVFVNLKKKGYNCEYIDEYAKKVVYEENFVRLKNQLIILSNQYYSMDMIRDKVNIIVTDSPLLLSIFYNKNQENEFLKVPDKLFKELVLHCYSTFDNLNYFITRNHEYKKEGRYQNEEEAIKDSGTIGDVISSLNLECKHLLSTDNCAEIILQDVEERYKFYQNLLKSGMEIEKKFLVSSLPKDIDKCRKEHILQGYIVHNEHEIRIRNVDNKQFLLTEKFGSGIQREEFEKKIRTSEYLANMKKVGERVVKKTRYYYPLNDGKIAEIDIYFGKNSGLRTVEVEFDNFDEAKKFKAPDWFGEDVTYDEKFRNSNLSLREVSAKEILTEKSNNCDKNLTV